MPSSWRYALPSTEKTGTVNTSTTQSTPTTIQPNNNDDDYSWLWIIGIIVGIFILLLIIWAIVYWFRPSGGQVRYVDECGNPIQNPCDPCNPCNPTSVPVTTTQCVPVHTQPMVQQPIVHTQSMVQQPVVQSPVYTSGYAPAYTPVYGQSYVQNPVARF